MREEEEFCNWKAKRESLRVFGGMCFDGAVDVRGCIDQESDLRLL